MLILHGNRHVRRLMMESDDDVSGLFMPHQRSSSKKKRPSERIDELDAEARLITQQRLIKRRLNGEIGEQRPQTLVIVVDTQKDIDRERRRQLDLVNRTRIHSHFQNLQPHLFVNNCLAVGQLAAYVYLDAMTITQCCFYWLGEYNNKMVAPNLLFNDIVEGVLTNLPQLEISGQFGLKYTKATNTAYCKKLRFLGSPLHQIPDVHFDLRLDRDERKNRGIYHPNHALLKGLGYVTQPLNRCFLSVHSPGSQAEFRADHFVYNTLLEDFFEPSFVLIALYHYALDGIEEKLLRRLFDGCTIQKSLVQYAQLEIQQWLVFRVKTMLQPLHRFIEQVTPLVRHTFSVGDQDGGGGGDDILDPYPPLADCIDRHDQRRVEKLRRLYCDVVGMARLLEENALDLTSLQRGLREKYTEKAAYCASQMPVRMQLLMNKLMK